MEKLTEKKRRWIINQYRVGRSATRIARIQRITRQHVYRLVARYKAEGTGAYGAKAAGRPLLGINSSFAKKIEGLRKETDYGSEKLHYVIKREGFNVSKRQIQKILDSRGLTEPCEKRRGQRKYVKYWWPLSNYMWHTDWSFYEDKWYIAFIDDCSRKIMAAGAFDNATEENALFVLYQAILTNEVCPRIILSDKGPQFYNNKKDNKGNLSPSKFEQELNDIGIKLVTSRRKHPQTNGKVEKWFDTMKKRFKKHPEESLPDFVRWYNEKRIHHALGYKTPEEVYREKV